MRYVWVAIVVMLGTACKSAREISIGKRHVQSLESGNICLDQSATQYADMLIKGRYHMIWYDTSAEAGHDGRPPVAAEVYAEEETQCKDSAITSTKAEADVQHIETIDEEEESDLINDDEGNSYKWKAAYMVSWILAVLLVCYIFKRIGLTDMMRKMIKK